MTAIDPTGSAPSLLTVSAGQVLYVLTLSTSSSKVFLKRSNIPSPSSLSLELPPCFPPFPPPPAEANPLSCGCLLNVDPGVKFNLALLLPGHVAKHLVKHRRAAGAVFSGKGSEFKGLVCGADTRNFRCELHHTDWAAGLQDDDKVDCIGGTTLRDCSDRPDWATIYLETRNMAPRSQRYSVCYLRFLQERCKKL